MEKGELKAIREELVLLRTGVLNPCSDYDPFGLCICTECFLCENCDYMIIDNEGNILKDFYSLDLTSEFEERAIYKVEFFDEGYFKNLKDFKEYIANDNSDYRLTRIFSDSNGEENTVLRLSKLDQEKIREKEEIWQREEEEIRERFYRHNCITNNSVANQPNKQDDFKPEGKIKVLVKHIFQKLTQSNN